MTQKLEKQNVLLHPDEVKLVDDIWHGERRRSRSETLRVLVREALVARGLSVPDIAIRNG